MYSLLSSKLPIDLSSIAIKDLNKVSRNEFGKVL